jgi:hypothetical protein
VTAQSALDAASQQPSAPRPSAPLPPTTAPAPAPAPSTPAAVGQRGNVTLVGCLYREDQVPGRKPNAAERAGVLEDYILAEATPAAAGRSGATPGATGTSGSSGPAMYKVENIPDEKLQAMIGKRVEVTGRLDAEGGPGGQPTVTPTPDRGPGPDAINLPEIEAASIREVSGGCAPTPAAR